MKKVVKIFLAYIAILLIIITISVWTDIIAPCLIGLIFYCLLYYLLKDYDVMK